MRITINVVEQGSLLDALATTGLSIAMLLGALALIVGVTVILHKVAGSCKITAAGAVIALTLANLAGGGAISEVNALVTPAKTPELTIILEQGSSATASDNAILNIAHASAWQLLASTDQVIDGLTLEINDRVIDASAVIGTIIDQGDSEISEDRSYPVSASASSDLALGKYDIEVIFNTVDKAQGGGDNSGGGENEPTEPTIADNLSMTNGSGADDWSNTLTNWAGGDLIITDEHLDTKFTTASVITVGGEVCTTTADNGANKNVITISAEVHKIGCVLPPLAQGSHDVKVDDVKVGTITYQKTAFTTKENIKQGEVQILTDTRTDGAGVSNKEYRVKCFSTDCWMIDNFAYQPTTSDLPSIQVIEGTDSANTGSVYTTPQVIITPTSLGTELKPEHGFLYNLCAVLKDSSSGCADSYTNFTSGNWAGGTILPTNWKVPTGNSGGQFANLSNAMKAKANANNPVYSTTEVNNFRNDAYASAGTDYNDAPWLGVYSGGYRSRLGLQGTFGYYWSSTASDGGHAYPLSFDSDGVYPAVANYKDLDVALRGVL